ncbi:MAG: DUF4274 domain-containing protein, partial [Anaerolineales bacterium]|nr:DUF4274 domain-containing protein [Anaerolineales bacterium]
WDYGHKPLKWVINQPQCDAGTASLIYWRSAPTWFCQFNNRNEVKDSGGDLKLFDLIQEIEEKFKKKFYKSQIIRFDPENDEGTNWTQQYADKDKKRAIPSIMMHPTKGQAMARESLVDFSHRDLTVDELAKVEQWVVKGFSVLHEKKLKAKSTSKPRSIVIATKKYVDIRRIETQGKNKINDQAQYVGWVFAEQVRRAYGWKWQVAMWDENSEINLFSPENTYRISPRHMIWFLVGRSWPNNLLKFFNTIGTAKRTQDFSEFYVDSMIHRIHYM